MANPRERWSRYSDDLCVVPSVGLSLDVSRMGHDASFLERMSSRMRAALDAMDALERGAIANPDEQRQVGHYWLRDPKRAPTPEIGEAIHSTIARVKAFAAGVHSGKIASASSGRFTHLLVVGIGGSALGPQLVSRAFATARDPMAVSFFDNTDPDGFDLVIDRLREQLSTTLVVVVSKSGGTKETRNGMLEVRAAMERAGIPFARHFVAVTGEGSALDRTAVSEGWLARFPMWDWVGGRTSELSAVGLLPAALQGIDIDAMLAGARDADAATRGHDVRANPSALLALMWHFAGDGRGRKDMVVLPYKDRLELVARYLQQLVMESLGKEKNVRGEVVHQGIAVYGNKGSTDQHAYVQQLRDGLPSFFVTFIQVLRDRASGAASMEVDTGVTSGDYLFGFLVGTRRALYESGRPSMTITLDEVSPRSLGALIAVYERAVGFYASLIEVNAYDQPGVEAGKKAAAEVIELQKRIVAFLAAETRGGGLGAESIAAGLGVEDVETVFAICGHLAANRRGVESLPPAGPGPQRPADARFRALPGDASKAEPSPARRDPRV